jgi:hypothetical protein
MKRALAVSENRVSIVSCNQIRGDWAISTNRMEGPFGLSLLISYTLRLGFGDG